MSLWACYLGRFVGIRILAVELVENIRTMQSVERTDYVGTIRAVIPEEVFALCQLLLGSSGGKYPLAGIRVDARVIYLSGHGHRRGRKVLHLLQMHLQPLGSGCKFGHILLATSGMTAYEVRYQLLAQAVAVIYAVKYLLEVIEQSERGLTHDAQHMVARMLRSHFKAS